jgi:hypothetical protein
MSQVPIILDPGELTPYQKFVNSHVKWLPTFGDDLLHAAVGIVGELIELADTEDADHSKEELGDIGFYICHWHLTLARWDILASSRKYDPHEVDSPWRACLHIAGDMLDFAKKVKIYNKPVLELPVAEAVDWLEDAYEELLAVSGFDRGDLEASNVVKLEKRYPTGYTDAAAQARADKESGK